MSNQSSTVATIKKGFFLGIGIVIPFACLEIASIQYAIYETKELGNEMMQDATQYETTMSIDYPETIIKTPQKKTADDITAEREEDTELSADNDFEEFNADFNRSYDKSMKLSPHQTTTKNGKLLVTGSVTNNATIAVNSIQIEAELFKDGTFVYECSKYISMPIEPNQSENYMIQCGCGKGDIPEFDTVTVKVTKASRF